MKEKTLSSAALLEVAKHLVAANEGIEAARTAIFRAKNVSGLTPDMRTLLEAKWDLLWADEVTIERADGNGRAFDMSRVLMEISKGA
jgi:hypothetical protein